jgi:phospholipase C
MKIQNPDVTSDIPCMVLYAENDGFYSQLAAGDETKADA